MSADAIVIIQCVRRVEMLLALDLIPGQTNRDSRPRQLPDWFETHLLSPPWPGGPGW